jgi:hypothetical protein
MRWKRHLGAYQRDPVSSGIKLGGPGRCWNPTRCYGEGLGITFVGTDRYLKGLEPVTMYVLYVQYVQYVQLCTVCTLMYCVYCTR